MSLNEEDRNPVMTKIAASSPIGRQGRPEEFANVISFITSPQASYMTGCDKLVDGGDRVARSGADRRRGAKGRQCILKYGERGRTSQR
jgi:enoyl-[acyl-carrier-protein] reductase (NADH)